MLIILLIFYIIPFLYAQNELPFECYDDYNTYCGNYIDTNYTCISNNRNQLRISCIQQLLDNNLISRQSNIQYYTSKCHNIIFDINTKNNADNILWKLIEYDTNDLIINIDNNIYLDHTNYQYLYCLNTTTYTFQAMNVYNKEWDIDLKIYDNSSSNVLLLEINDIVFNNINDIIEYNFTINVDNDICQQDDYVICPNDDLNVTNVAYCHINDRGYSCNCLNDTYSIYNNECIICTDYNISANCNICNKEECLYCKDNYILSSDKKSCIKECPNNLSYNPITNTCQQCIPIYIILNTEKFANEISFGIYLNNTNELIYIINYNYNDLISFHTYNINYCLQDGTYYIKALDNNNDGWHGGKYTIGLGTYTNPLSTLVGPNFIYDQGDINHDHFNINYDYCQYNQPCNNTISTCIDLISNDYNSNEPYVCQCINNIHDIYINDTCISCNELYFDNCTICNQNQCIQCDDNMYLNYNDTSCVLNCENEYNTTHCIATNPCITDPNICTGLHEYCQSSSSSFYDCLCNEGYEKIDDQCININECELDIDLCDISHNCIDNNGSYTCTCNNTTIGDGYCCISANQQINDDLIIEQFNCNQPIITIQDQDNGINDQNISNNHHLNDISTLLSTIMLVNNHDVSQTMMFTIEFLLTDINQCLFYNKYGQYMVYINDNSQLCLDIYINQIYHTILIDTYQFQLHQYYQIYLTINIQSYLANKNLYTFMIFINGQLYKHEIISGLITINNNNMMMMINYI